MPVGLVASFLYVIDRQENLGRCVTELNSSYLHKKTRSHVVIDRKRFSASADHFGYVDKFFRA